MLTKAQEIDLRGYGERKKMLETKWDKLMTWWYSSKVLKEDAVVFTRK